MPDSRKSKSKCFRLVDFLIGSPIQSPLEKVYRLEVGTRMGRQKSETIQLFQVDLIPGTAGESIGELDFPIESNRLTRRQQSSYPEGHQGVPC